MKRFLNIIIRILVIVLIIYVIAAALLNYFVKPDTYKNLVSDAVYKKTGMELMIHGKLDFTFFPWLGVRVQTMQLDNPKGYEAPNTAPYFVQIGEADAQLALWPLFTGRIEPRKVVLKNTIINLVTNKKGQSNWHSLLQQPSENTKSTSDSEKTTQLAKAKFKFPIIVIKNANLNWVNQQTDKVLKLQNFNLTAGPIFGGSKLRLHSNFRFTDNDPNIDLTLKMDATADPRLRQQIFKLDDLKIDGELSTYKNKLPEPVKVSLSGNFDLFQRENRIVIKNVKATLANLSFKGNVNGTNIMAAAVYTGSVKMPTFNPKVFLNSIGVNYIPANKNVMQKLSGELEFKLSDNQISLPSMTLNLDDSNLQGNFSYIKKNVKDINFDISLDRINLDGYLPKSSTKKPVKKKSAPKAQSKNNNTAQPAELNGLRGWQWQGNFKASQIVWHDVKLQNVVVNSSAKDNQINIKPINANVDTGNFSMRLNIDLTGETPEINSELSTYKIPLKTLMKMAESRIPLEGNLSLQAQLQSRGNIDQAIRNNLNGSGKLTINKGRLNGININKAINIGLVALKKKPSKLKQDEDVTLFETINASFTITNGILINNDLRLLSSGLQASGQGRINLRTMRYDPYRIKAVSEAFSDFEIPIMITGPLANPRVQVDVASLTGSTLKRVIKKELKKIPGQPFKNLNIDKLLPF